MSYATTDDVQARYLENDLIAMTDQTNQAVDLTRLQAALDDASAEIDGYLGVRYVLPLVDSVTAEPIAPPALLLRICVDMAVYGLMTLRPEADVKDARQRYEGGIRMLKLMSVGDVQIAGAQMRNGQAVFPHDSAQSPGGAMVAAARQADSFGRRFR